MAQLLPGPDVTLGEATAPTREFKLSDYYGTPIDVTSYAFRYRWWKRYLDENDVWQEREYFDLAGVTTGLSPTKGQFKFVFTHEHTSLAPGRYRAELAVWSSGTVTNPPTERWRGILTIERRIETP